jgi:adhesin transport system membrane fusion protein
VSTEMENPTNLEATAAKEKPSAVNFIADSHSTVYRRVPQKAANALYLLAGIILISFIWAYFAKLDVSTSANGKIIASSQMQAVQHLEGGIVNKILVKTGDHVKKGQVLVLLDDTRFKSEYNEGTRKVAVLQADIVRLSAKAQDKDHLEFDPAFEAANPVQVAEAKEFFIRDKTSFDQNIALLEKQYALMKKELAIIAPLAKQGVVSDVERLRLERDLINHQQTILEKKTIELDQAREQLSKTQGEYSVLSESLAESKDRMVRTVIRAPTDGTVNQIHVTTIGEVIKPGDTIIEIVPLEDQLTVQAFVRPSDIGFIYVGQKAIVKVSAFDYSIYGGLHASVENVGADAVKDKQDNSFYEVRLHTNKSYLESRDKKLQLIPGMTVTVSILTGKKSVMEYILKPFNKARQSALQER